MLKQMLYRYQGQVSAALVLGGMDVNGPALYSIYPHGSTDKLPYVTMGSGSLAAMGVFEDGFKVDMEKEEGCKLVRDAIAAGIFNDLVRRPAVLCQPIGAALPACLPPPRALACCCRHTGSQQRPRQVRRLPGGLAAVLRRFARSRAMAVGADLDATLAPVPFPLQGSGSNVDICIITADGVEYIRPYEIANKRGVRQGDYSYKRGTTAVTATEVLHITSEVIVGDGMDTA